MQFGVTFYPDQYPKDIWEKEFSEIKKTGFEVVRFAEMAWSWVEPIDGTFKFDDLDHALALCEKHKLKVMLGVPVSQAPLWLVKKHPEILHLSADGLQHPAYGPRPNGCRDNPQLKEYVERLAEKLAERYGKHPAVYMWQIDNEPTYPPLDLTELKDYCHCSATSIAFNKWAKEKYNSIEKLNGSWGTSFWGGTFSDFSEITPPKCGMWDAGNPHIYLDWNRFKSEQLSKWLKNVKKIIREFDKEHKIGTNSFTTIVPRSVDHRVIAQEMDWFGWDIYPKGTQNTEESLAQIADYWRSVCDSVGAEFVVSELQGGPNVRWGNGDWVLGTDIKQWVKLLDEHGAKLIMFHNWRPPLFGSETGGFGLTKPDGTPTERLEAVRELIKERRRSKVESGKSRVEIYYSRSSDLQAYQEEGPTRPCPPDWFSGRGDLGLFYGNNSIAGAYRLLWEEDIQPDFLFEKDLENKSPASKIILLTNPYLLSRKQFDNIKEFVNNGGILIAESRFGLKDEHAHLYEKPLLEELLGVEHIRAEAINKPLNITKIEAKASGFRDFVRHKEKKSKVLEKYEDGFPAIIEKRIGKGYIIYATFSMFSSFIKFGNNKLASFLQKIITTKE